MSETGDKSSPLSSWSGRILERRYRLGRVVGRGGFGTVFEGRHLTLDVPIAVKMLHLSQSHVGASMHQDLLSAFFEEARMMARLRHPNIVAVLDSGIATSDNGQTPSEATSDDASSNARSEVPSETPSPDPEPAIPWIVMEWCEGEPLDEDLLRRGSKGRSVEEVWKLLGPIVDAVAYGHEHGIVHRDIKPANIMLSRSNRGGVSARLLDFGIAKNVTPDEKPGSGRTATQSDRRTFTPAYAAPEQIVGGRTGTWTDVHALALLFVEALAGAAPYGTEDLMISAVAPDRPTPKRHGLEVGAWEQVLEKALSVRPSDRYADAAELWKALDAALAPTERTERAEVRAVPSSSSAEPARSAPFGAEQADTLIAATATPGNAPRNVAPSNQAPKLNKKRVRNAVLATAVAILAATLTWVAFNERSPSATPDGEPQPLATPFAATPPILDPSVTAAPENPIAEPSTAHSSAAETNETTPTLPASTPKSASTPASTPASSAKPGGGKGAPTGAAPPLKTGATPATPPSSNSTTSKAPPLYP